MNANRPPRITIPERERRALVEAARAGGATLNGERAHITGVMRDFARVTQATSGLSAEWAWPTVARVIANGGCFLS